MADPKLTTEALSLYLCNRMSYLSKTEKYFVSRIVMLLGLLPPTTDLLRLMSTATGPSIDLSSVTNQLQVEDAEAILGNQKRKAFKKDNGNFFLCAVMQILIHYTRATMLKASEQYKAEYCRLGRSTGTFVADMILGNETFELLCKLGFMSEYNIGSKYWDSFALQYYWPYDAQFRSRIEEFSIDPIMSKRSETIAKETCEALSKNIAPHTLKYETKIETSLTSILFPIPPTNQYSRCAWAYHIMERRLDHVVDEHRAYWARVYNFKQAPMKVCNIVSWLAQSLKIHSTALANEWVEIAINGVNPIKRPTIGAGLTHRTSRDFYTTDHSGTRDYHGNRLPAIKDNLGITVWDPHLGTWVHRESWEGTFWSESYEYRNGNGRKEIPADQLSTELPASDRRCVLKGCVEALPTAAISKILKKGGMRWEG